MHRILTGLALATGLAAASIVTASAQQYGDHGDRGYPPGSYQQSCGNVQMRGSVLYASCTATSGQRVYSSLNVNGCNGDIANSDGHLVCNGGYGYGNSRRNEDDNNGGEGDDGYHGHHHQNDGGGYGNDLPPGSYQQSCTNVRMYGSTLGASCTAPNGSYVHSSIDVRRCESRGSDIENRNGYLSC